MKRLYISIALMAAILAIAGHAMYSICQMEQELLGDLAQIKQTAQAGDLAATIALSDSFTERWVSTKKQLSRFVRHNQLDEITGLSDQLHAFAQYEDTANLHACIDRIAGCVEEIWHNEIPYISNIL